MEEQHPGTQESVGTNKHQKRYMLKPCSRHRRFKRSTVTSKGGNEIRRARETITNKMEIIHDPGKCHSWERTRQTSLHGNRTGDGISVERTDEAPQTRNKD